MYTYEIDMSNQNPFNPLPKNQIDYQQTNNVGGYMASRNNYQGEIEQMNDNVNSNQCKGNNIKNIRYRGSQSWPFPDQLMLGFTAEYESGELKLQKESQQLWTSGIPLHRR